MRKYKFFLLFSILISNLANAQKGTQSPYSIFGIGELNMGQYASFMSMGGVSMACTDSTIGNHNNPSSYAYINRNKPVFQVGLNGRYSSFQTFSNSATQSHMGLNQFLLALPIKKNWGSAIGLVPYSFTGYTISNYVTNSDGDTTNHFVNEGSGSISKVFIGLSFRALNYIYVDSTQSRTDSTKFKVVQKKHFLSIGVHGNYLFGSSTKILSYEYSTWENAFNSRVHKGTRISDGSVDFGLNYQYIFKPMHTDTLMNGSVSIGLGYSPGFKMRAYQDVFSYNYFGSFYGNSPLAANVLDTIENVVDREGVIFIPDQYKIGFEYRFGWKASRKGERQLRVGIDVNYQKWSNYYEGFGNSTVASSPFKDRLGVALGMEYRPFIGNDPAVSILSRTNYRLGFHYTQTELSLNGVNLNDYGMSFGIGLPMNINSTNTNLNLGATFGNMGTTQNNLIRERYLGFYFGISIIPDRNEAWFVKRKYD